MFFPVLCYLCLFLVGVRAANDKCFCSATGDPHIRSYDGSTSNVGPGDYTLTEDTKSRFKVSITVAQTSPTLTQITSVDVALAGDTPENIPGYGMVHRANGLEIRVLKNNNVFIIWDPTVGDILQAGTLCGQSCGEAAEPTSEIVAKDPKKAAAVLASEVKKQQLELEKISVASVTTELTINDVKRVVDDDKEKEAAREQRFAAVGGTV